MFISAINPVQQGYNKNRVIIKTGLVITMLRLMV